MPSLPLIVLALAATTYAQQPPATPPSAEQVEAWTGLTVMTTSTAEGQPVGPSVLLFEEPMACPLGGGDGHHVDARLADPLLATLAAARKRVALDTLPVDLRGTQSWTFRLADSGAQLWLRISDLEPHHLPLPTLYAHGLLRQCSTHKALDLRLEHQGRHWQIQGPCSMSASSVSTLVKTLEQQLHPTWLVASPCGGMSVLDEGFMAEAGIAGQPMIEALGGVVGGGL